MAVSKYVLSRSENGAVGDRASAWLLLGFLSRCKYILSTTLRSLYKSGISDERLS